MSSNSASEPFLIAFANFKLILRVNDETSGIEKIGVLVHIINRVGDSLVYRNFYK